MREIIDNLGRQHKDLVKVTMRLVGQLDGVGRGGTAEAYASVRALAGTLRVHLAMEDESFYPYLVKHRDGDVRAMAQRFLAERQEIQARFDAYQARWRSIAAIDAAPAAFVSETRSILQTLGERMLHEDREFHPAIKGALAAE